MGLAQVVGEGNLVIGDRLPNEIFRRSLFIDAAVLVCDEKDSEAVLGVWLPAPLPTSRALPDRGALWPLA